jgi:hypothetical protein
LKEGFTLRLSALIAVGLVVTVAAWAFFAWFARPGRELADIAKLQQQIRPVTAAAITAPEDLAAGLCTTGLDQAESDTRMRIQSASAANHVTLIQLSLSPTPSPGRQLSAVALAMRAKGSESDLMQFIGATAAERPALIFDQVTLQRAADATELDLDLEARLVCARV